MVDALQALRGVGLIGAVTIMAEIGDLRRFDSQRQLMGYLGLVPGERSTGDSMHLPDITKGGNGRVQRTLIEGAWTYRHLPRTGRAKLVQHERVLYQVPLIVTCPTLVSAQQRSTPRSGPTPTQVLINEPSYYPSCATSRPKHKRGCAPATGRCRARARS